MALAKTLNERIPRRAILGSMMFLAAMFSYVGRTNLSMIIVAMVEPLGKNSSTPPCHPDFGLNTTKVAEKPNYGVRFPWGEGIQAVILGAYFVGTVPSSAPAGYLAEKIGGSRVVAFATLIPAVLNLLMPWAAKVTIVPGYALVCIIRFIMGFFGSAVYPALHAMIARWVPPSEKGMFVWTMQGGPFGTFVTLTLCGLIIHYWKSWELAYYVTSGLMLIFYVLWVYLIYDTPDEHPTITEKEKNYIKEQIGTTVSKKQNKLPLESIATSLPFIVLLYAHFANMWGIYFIASYGPKYLSQILGFDMKNSGALSGSPYIARLFAGVVFAAAGDYCRRKSIVTLGSLRRIFMLFSHCGPAVCLLVATYAGCDRTLVVAMIILSLTFNGAACQTSLQNHQDLAPNFAGSLYGIMNTFGSFSGFIVPAVVGLLTKDHNGLEEWRYVFWLSAIIFFSSTVSFWLFGSTDIQPWNNVESNARSADYAAEEELQEKVPMKGVQSNGEEDENEKL
ncbi:hypothetical protein QAD02_006775 [Eretmocerus hayati]|uniref:Uncharacterized protein n=1 Tax=Eretmocerus hayati TaxID=131215 RepID=A0ACC2N2A2_9HYME|nr:hypothetical protein QAD02_006775 [Eretmocerus hayati]